MAYFNAAALFILALMPYPCTAGTEISGQSVLLLNSYYPGYAWSDALVTTIQNALPVLCPDASLYVEYMDASRFPAGDVETAFADMIAAKYSSKPLDAVVVSDDVALRFALDARKRLFNQIPLIFCGVLELPEGLLDSRDNLTGIAKTVDIKETLDVALRLHPGTKRVYVLTDDTVNGATWNTLAKKQLASYSPIAVEYLDGRALSTDSMFEIIHALPADSLILLTQWRRGASSRTYAPVAACRKICRISRAPVYGVVAELLGAGIVGGKLDDGAAQGRAAASLVARILGGAQAESIPISFESINDFKFDYTQLTAWHIPENHLPPGSIVVNRPMSFYRENQVLLFLVSIGMFLFLLLSVGLTFNIQRRKRAEQALRESEQRFRTISEQNRMALLIIQDDRPSYANPSFQEMTGYHFEEIRDWTIGEGVEKLVHPQDWERTIDLYAHISSGVLDTRERITLRGLKRDGESYYVETVMHTIDYDGRPAALITGLDITELHQVMQALQESEERFRAIFETTPDSIFCKGLDRRYTFINPAMAKELGKPALEIIGKTPEELYPPEAAAAIAEVDAINFKGDIVDQEATLFFDGRERNYHVIQLPLRDAEGTVHGICGIVRNITQRKKEAEERLRLEDRVRETQKLESLGVLAGGIAHDFNNLLVGILGNAGILLEDMPEDSPDRACIEDIATAGRRAADLCRQMLAYAGQGKMRIEPISLNPLLKEMARLLRASIGKNTVFVLSAEDELPPIEADETQVRQVVMNLITNAAEAIGDAEGTISLETGRMHCDNVTLGPNTLIAPSLTGEYVFLRVEDTGCGFDAALRERIFEPFYSTKFAGRGLGLSAVLGIVRSHGGMMEVTSTVGRGSTFLLAFPALCASVEIASKEMAEVRRSRTQEHILLADDEAPVRAVGTRLLEREGYKATVAKDGLEAIEIVRDNPARFAAAIIDWTMPRLSGLQTVEELRRIQPSLKIILASGYNQDEIEAAFPKGLVNGFIQKPFELGGFRAIIAEVLGPDDPGQE